jgi:hypothetical protein
MFRMIKSESFTAKHRCPEGLEAPVGVFSAFLSSSSERTCFSALLDFTLSSPAEASRAAD